MRLTHHFSHFPSCHSIPCFTSKWLPTEIQTVGIFTQCYVAARLTHKNVSSETAVSGISKVHTKRVRLKLDKSEQNLPIDQTQVHFLLEQIKVINHQLVAITPHNPTSSRQLVERDTSFANETKSTLKSNRNRNQSLKPQSIIYCNINGLYNTKNKCSRKLLE